MCLRTLFLFTETYVSSLYFIIFLKLLYVKGRKKEDSPDKSLTLFILHHCRIKCNVKFNIISIALTRWFL